MINGKRAGMLKDLLLSAIGMDSMACRPASVQEHLGLELQQSRRAEKGLATVYTNGKTRRNEE